MLSAVIIPNGDKERGGLQFKKPGVTAELCCWIYSSDLVMFVREVHEVKACAHFSSHLHFEYIHSISSLCSRT